MISSNPIALHCIRMRWDGTQILVSSLHLSLELHFLVLYLFNIVTCISNRHHTLHVSKTELMTFCPKPVFPTGFSILVTGEYIFPVVESKKPRVILYLLLSHSPCPSVLEFCLLAFRHIWTLTSLTFSTATALVGHLHPTLSQ